jgi:hypothetical protein
MKFGEGRGFCDTILKTEKELVPTICTGYVIGRGRAGSGGVGKGGRAAGKAEQVVSGRQGASLEIGVYEDGTSKGRAGMSRARDVPSRTLNVPCTVGPTVSYLALPSIQTGYKLAAGEKDRWMAPNWYWEAPGSGSGKSGGGRGGGGMSRRVWGVVVGMEVEH